MIESKLITLFKRYRHAFEEYQLAQVQQCYKLPCTLQSAEQIVYIDSEATFSREFSDIFTILKHANVCSIKAVEASYTEVSESVVMCIVNWKFFDKNNELFTDFSAVYHLIKATDDYKIFNIVSHESNNAISLAYELGCENINV